MGGISRQFREVPKTQLNIRHHQVTSRGELRVTAVCVFLFGQDMLVLTETKAAGCTKCTRKEESQ